MKKKILSFMIAAGFLLANTAISAQVTPIENRLEYVNNLLTNGGFDDEGFIQSNEQVYDWTSEFESYNADSIPGWHRIEGVANGCVAIAKGDGDSRYVHYQFSNKNGWTGFGLMQSVDSLIPGKEYTFDFLVAHHFSNKEANISYGFEIIAKSNSMTEEIDEIVKVKGDLDPGDGNYGYYVQKFTSKTDGVIICLMGYNWGGSSDNKNGNAWINWDEVRLYDASETGIGNVLADEASSQEIYDLQGRHVKNPTPGQVYIRQGKKFIAR